MSLFDLSGRVAVVSGGTTGLGRAIAVGLAEAGADVVPTSRRLEQVGIVASEIEALGRRSMRVTSVSGWFLGRMRSRASSTVSSSGAASLSRPRACRVHAR